MDNKDAQQRLGKLRMEVGALLLGFDTTDKMFMMTDKRYYTLMNEMHAAGISEEHLDAQIADMEHHWTEITIAIGHAKAATRNLRLAMEATHELLG